MNLTNYVFYNNGASGASAVVGVSDRLPRNVRYSFTAPATGASSISLRFQGSEGAGTTPNTLRFAITTDPNSHAAANWNTPGDGVITRISGGYAYEGSANVLLLPGLTYYLFIYPDSSTFGWVRWYTAEGYATLETAGGAYSSLTAPGGTLGHSMSLKVTRFDTTFRHKITYTFGKASGTIYEGAEETLSWTPALSLAEQIPAAVAGTAMLSITTFDGSGKQIGVAQAVPVILSVPDTVVPGVAFTWQDLTGAANVYGMPVQNVSALEVKTTASGAYGSTVTATAVQLEGKAYDGGVISGCGNLTMTVTVTDSRGRTATDSEVISVLEYQMPVLTLDASRCTASGEKNDEGDYALVTVTGAISSLGGQNSGALTLRYAASEGGAAYEEAEDPITPANAFQYTWVVEAPSEYAMSLTATVQDSITAVQRSMTLSVGYATLDLLAGGKGIAIGTTAKKAGFTCAMDAEFTGNVSGVLPCGESTEYPGCFYRVVAGETEWYNPPFVVGTEYRTTQRWKNRPVYAKLLQFTGLFPNGAQTHYFGNQFPGVTEVVSVKATGTNGSIVVSLPFVDQANNFSCWAYNNSGGQIAIASNYKTAYTTVYALVQYIK